MTYPTLSSIHVQAKTLLNLIFYNSKHIFQINKYLPDLPFEFLNIPLSTL